MASFQEPERARQTSGHVVGMFDDRSAAESAIDALKRTGIGDGSISVAMRDQDAARELGNESGADVAEGAAAGAVSGGVVGGALGLLAGIGAFAIPGIGPVVAAGWLGSTLLGAGVGAAAGGIIGGLVGMGIPEEDARRFDTAFREGGILVAVDAGSHTDRAESIMRSNGADVSRAEMSGERSLERAGSYEGTSTYVGRERRRRSGRGDYRGPERRQAQL